MRLAMAVMVALVLAVATWNTAEIPSTSVNPRVWTKRRPPTPQAYFSLEYGDMTTPAWPDHYWPYTVIVCSQSFQNSDVIMSKIGGGREPVSKSLCYFNAQDIDVAGTFSGAYWDTLEAMFDSTWCIMDLDADTCVRMDSPRDHPAWIPFGESADSLIAFASRLPFNLYGGDDWDGAYIDNCTADIQSFRIALLPAHFDCDGDGLADTVQEMQEQWDTYRPYLISGIRGVIGDGRILLANTAGDVPNADLNGITIEGVGHTISYAEAKSAFESQRSVAHAPFLSVAWVTQVSTDADSCFLMTSEVPGVYYGIVE